MEQNEHQEIQILVADESHEKYVDTILKTIEDAAKVRGTGIAKRTHEYVATKMREAKAVIALAPQASRARPIARPTLPKPAITALVPATSEHIPPSSDRGHAFPAQRGSRARAKNPRRQASMNASTVSAMIGPWNEPK